MLSNSSCLLLNCYVIYNDKFYVQSVISDHKGISNNTSSEYHDLKKEDRRSNDTLIEDLRLSGPYEVIISLNGSSVMPSPLESYYNYVGTSIPTGSDIVLKLHTGSTAEFLATNGSGQKLFRFGNEGEIHLYNVRESENGTNISVLLKRPEIRVANGKINFVNLHNVDPWARNTELASTNSCEFMVSKRIDCSQLEVNGKMVGILDHVDNYNQGIEANTLSYIKSLEIEQNKIDE
jgi:hypothetical protein